MPQAPTKKPAAPGSTPPQGPTNPAASLYSALSKKAAVSAAKPGAQPIGAPQTATNGRVVTKGAVPVKTAKNLPGNQGAHNSHTQRGKVKPVGSTADLRKTGSVTSVKNVATRVYPHLS